MTKHLAEKYSLCHTYGRSKALIKRRLNQIEHHLQRAQSAIEQLAKEIVSKCAQYGDWTSAMSQLSSILHQFAQEKQWPLQHGFEYKTQMLILDATDQQLIQKFFDVKPNKPHVKNNLLINLTTFSSTTNINLFQILSAKCI